MRPRLPRKSKAVSAALWCPPPLDTTTSHYKLNDLSSLARQLRQLGDVHRNPPRLIGVSILLTAGSVPSYTVLLIAARAFLFAFFCAPLPAFFTRARHFSRCRKSRLP